MSITTLSDTAAVRILLALARTQLERASSRLAVNEEISHALSKAFPDVYMEPVSEGELARAALALLSENPTYAEPIQLMAREVNVLSKPQRYIEPTTILLTTAVLLVLQTRIKFKAGRGGDWAVEVDKKSLSDSAVKLVVERLLSFINR